MPPIPDATDRCLWLKPRLEHQPLRVSSGCFRIHVIFDHPTLVSNDPFIWMADDCLPAEFLQMVNGAFDSADGTGQCQVVKKPNGREILARNIDFQTKDEVCQEAFRRMSSLCGISGAMPFSEFMVSEVLASGQDAHVDHVNVDDVGGHLEFLDLTRQSFSESEPRRIVPTISIIVYFNAVGGICFPSATGMKTVAAKVGRLVMFHNYDDKHRPSHKASAEHYGIYFENLPRRVLIMGVLANHTPQFSSLAKTSEALVYPTRSLVPLPQVMVQLPLKEM